MAKVFRACGSWTLFVLALILSACTKKPTPGSPAQEQEPTALAERGRQIYKLNCTACHNPDPKLDGAVGPAISGASLELLTARVLTTKYPDGYKPKRVSNMMPAFPQLEKELAAIHAYLSAP